MICWKISQSKVNNTQPDIYRNSHSRHARIIIVYTPISCMAKQSLNMGVNRAWCLELAGISLFSSFLFCCCCCCFFGGEEGVVASTEAMPSCLFVYTINCLWGKGDCLHLLLFLSLSGIFGPPSLPARSRASSRAALARPYQCIQPFFIAHVECSISPRLLGWLSRVLMQ